MLMNRTGFKTNHGFISGTTMASVSMVGKLKEKKKKSKWPLFLIGPYKYTGVKTIQQQHSIYDKQCKIMPDIT
jgi:hypothetical protein